MKSLFFALLILIALNAHAQTQAPDAKKGIENANKAKSPKGKISFEVDGKTYRSAENTTQCMFVGAGSMSQGMVTGRNAQEFLLTVTFMGTPQVGEVPSKRKGWPVPNIGINLTIGKDSYDFTNELDFSLNITKLAKDGQNSYIAGVFSGTLKSKDGKKITIHNGKFESAYL